LPTKEAQNSALAQAESAGINQTGQIGGQPKQKYYTPDGSIIFAMPDIHEYQQTSKGKVVAQGLRDANLDRGWLLSKPEKLQIYCGGCDKWHPTQKEVNACIKKKSAFTKEWEAKAKKDLPKDASAEMAEMKTEMKELKTMFSEVLEKLGGNK